MAIIFLPHREREREGAQRRERERDSWQFATTATIITTTSATYSGAYLWSASCLAPQTPKNQKTQHGKYEDEGVLLTGRGGGEVDGRVASHAQAY